MSEKVTTLQTLSKILSKVITMSMGRFILIPDSGVLKCNPIRFCRMKD